MMQLMNQRSSLCLGAARKQLALPRRAIVVKASSETPAEGTSQTPKAPEWVPEQAAPILNFLESDNFKLEESEVYKGYLAQYVENEWVAKSTGWKSLPETINGRAAMLGFVAAAGAEVFGQGPVLTQLSKTGLPVVIVLAVVIASTIIPVYNGFKGEYLESLRDIYSIPPGVFTERNEKIHGRLAMLGLATLIALELVFGRAIL